MIARLGADRGGRQPRAPRDAARRRRRRWGCAALTGAGLAGVYPVGMKVLVGWGTRDRGALVGLLRRRADRGLGAAAPPRLLRRRRLAGDGGGGLGAGGARRRSAAPAPGSGRTTPARRGFDPGALRLAWTDRRVRLAYAGYLGHMWELYAFWAWIGAAAAAVLRRPARRRRAAGGAAGRPSPRSRSAALLCLPAGRLADRIGKARVAQARDGGQRRRPGSRRRAPSAGRSGWWRRWCWSGARRSSPTRRSSRRWSPTPRRRSAPAACCAADRARLHPHLLHRAGGAAGRRRRSAGRRRWRCWRSGPAVGIAAMRRLIRLTARAVAA